MRTTYHDKDGHGMRLELRVLLQRHVGVAQEREHLLRRRRDLKDPAVSRGADGGANESKGASAMTAGGAMQCNPNAVELAQGYQ